MQTVSKTMPETNIHRGDEEVGGVQPHSYYHNVSTRLNETLSELHHLMDCNKTEDMVVEDSTLICFCYRH